MRQQFAVGGILALTLSTSNAQQPATAISTLTAMNHIGEVATVCGRVEDAVCRRGSTYMTLTLGPADQLNTVTIAILGADLQSSGTDVDRFFGQTVCVRGKIEKVSDSLQIAVPDPASVEVQTQERVLPPIPSDAFSACDPDVVLPVVVREVKPQYTASAMRARAMGRVKMRAVVDAEGRVRDVQLMRSLHPALDEAAIQALRQWVFRAGTRMGKPVAVVVVVDMAFALRG